MAQKESGGMELQELQEEKASGIPQFLWEAPASQGTMRFSFTATTVTERRRWTMRNQQSGAQQKSKACSTENREPLRKTGYN